jgi:thioredoxin-related protein
MEIKLFSAALFLAGALCANSSPAASLADEEIFNPIMEIRLREDAQLAQRKGQILMIMFTKDGCSPCIQMKKQVLTNPRVHRFFSKHFLSYTVNIFGDLPIIDRNGEALTEKTYAKRENIWGTPTFYFFDHDGRLLHKHTGFLSTEAFLSLGQKVMVVARQSRHALPAFQ